MGDFIEALPVTADNCPHPNPIISPAVGEVYQHVKTGRKYVILATDIEAAGELRNLVQCGNFHVYQCMTTQKLFVRWSKIWDQERNGFKLVAEAD